MGFTKATIVTPMGPNTAFVPDDYFHERLELGKVDKKSRLPYSKLPSDQATEILTGHSRPYVCTKFTLYVPKPRHGSHIPSVFMAVSNSASAPVVCRFNADDLDSLKAFLDIHTASVYRAIDDATLYRDKLVVLTQALDSSESQINPAPPDPAPS